MADACWTPDVLWVRIQMALRCNQAELADLVGVERRTIQRWQDRGGHASAAALLEVAGALDPLQPELAAEVRAIVSQDPTIPTEPQVIATIVEAAAVAVGMSSEAVKPAVEAAFRAAKAQRQSVDGVVLALACERGEAGV